MKKLIYLIKSFWRRQTARGPWCDDWGILEEEHTDILVGGGYEGTTKEDYKYYHK